MSLYYPEGWIIDTPQNRAAQWRIFLPSQMPATKDRF